MSLNVCKQTFHISHAHISKSSFNVKSSTYYFHMKTKIMADFQICISIPLRYCKEIADLLFWVILAWLSTPKMIVSNWKNLSCLFFPFSLRYFRNIANLLFWVLLASLLTNFWQACLQRSTNFLFWVLWACLAASIKNDKINL